MSFFSDFIRKNGPEVHAFFTGGLPYFILSKNPQPLHDGLPVFCYHLVQSDDFEQDLRFLSDNAYKTLTADELLAHINQKDSHSGSSVVLSFDDGAANFYQVAFPLLKKYRHKAVLFISPGLHRDACAENLASSRRPCTWEELVEMHASDLVDIQSHTWVHRSLIDWPQALPLAGIDDATIAGRRSESLTMEEDLYRSKTTIEQRLQKQVNHLALPQYVGSDDAVQQACKQGHQCFWRGICPRHPLNIPGQDPLQIVRVSGEFTRRLPGNHRRSLINIFKIRYATALKKHTQRVHRIAEKKDHQELK